jgi:predicted transcriptional regulator
MIKNIGPLEKRILDILWERKKATAREISNSLERIGERRAYSTVRTIIRRLVKKRIISEKLYKKERTFIYTPILTKNDLEKIIVKSVIGELLTKFKQSTVSYLSEELSENQEEIEKIRKKLDEMK